MLLPGRIGPLAHPLRHICMVPMCHVLLPCFGANGRHDHGDDGDDDACVGSCGARLRSTGGVCAMERPAALSEPQPSQLGAVQPACGSPVAVPLSRSTVVGRSLGQALGDAGPRMFTAPTPTCRCGCGSLPTCLARSFLLLGSGSATVAFFCAHTRMPGIPGPSAFGYLVATMHPSCGPSGASARWHANNQTLIRAERCVASSRFFGPYIPPFGLAVCVESSVLVCVCVITCMYVARPRRHRVRAVCERP